MSRGVSCLLLLCAAAFANAQTVTPDCAGHRGGKPLVIVGTGLVEAVPEQCVALNHASGGIPVGYAHPTEILAFSTSRAAASAVQGVISIVSSAGTQTTNQFTVAVRGDANDTGTREASDMFYMSSHIANPGTYPLPCLCSGDANSDGTVTTADIFFLNAFLLAVGPEPGP